MGVPALDRQVHAADERQGIVDADDLLVVGGIKRVMGVELELKARVVLPVGAEDERPGSAGGMHDGNAPHQDPDLKVRLGLNERAEQGAERRGFFGAHVRAQADAAVEVPADDEDRAPAGAGPLPDKAK